MSIEITSDPNAQLRCVRCGYLLRGLGEITRCPECGLELATGPHRHEDESIDPRLEALRGFRVDGDDESA